MDCRLLTYVKAGIGSVAVSFRSGLVLSISILAAIFFALWRLTDDPWKEFGLNAFTETVGIGLTVLLIDRLIRKQERRRLRPLELAAFHDVQSFVDGLATSWLNVYKWSGKGELPEPPDPPSIQDFLTMPYFEEIRQRLNLDSEACVFPKRTWWQYLPHVEDEYRKLGEKILERHSAVLDPNAYHLVHRVVNGFLKADIGLGMLHTMKQTGGFGAQDFWNALPERQRHRLGRYWILIEEHLKDVADLHSWYRSNKKTYFGHD
jgi:hypothetical protein